MGFTLLLAFVTNSDSLIYVKMAKVVLDSGCGIQGREKDEEKVFV